MKPLEGATLPLLESRLAEDVGMLVLMVVGTTNVVMGTMDVTITTEVSGI